MTDEDVVRIVHKFFNNKKIDINNKIYYLEENNKMRKGIMRGIAIYNGQKRIGYAVPKSETLCAFLSTDYVKVIKR